MKYLKPLSMVFFLCLGFLGCKQSFPDLFEKAKKQFQEKNYVETIDTLNLALTRWKTSNGIELKAQGYQLLGQTYHEIHKMDQARDAFQEAIKLSENTFESAYALGLIYLTSRENQKALVSFRDALRMKKDDPLALVGLGNTYFSMKDYSTAKLMFERVLETSPGVKEAREGIDSVKSELQRTAHAKKTIAPILKKKSPTKTTNMKLQRSEKKKKK